MQIGSPFDALHGALSQATAFDLPAHRYWARDWIAYNKLSKEEKAKVTAHDKGPGEWKERRPDSYDVEVVMFPQTWGSTALGYGGIGGQAMTPAYTVIVSDLNVSCVYFGGSRLAYRIDHSKQTPEGREAFRKDVASQSMAHRSDVGKYK